MKKIFVLLVVLGLLNIASFAQVQIWSYFSDSGYLGVQVQEVTKENYSKYGLSSVQGVAVEEVIKDSPAAQAGIQAGDVIIRFNREEVTSVRKLRRLISEVAPDHQAKITVLRKGKEIEFTVTLGKKSEPQIENIRIPMPKLPERIEIPPIEPPLLPDYRDHVFVFRGANRRIGVEIMPLTKQLGEYFGVADGKGLLVTQVKPDSPAAKAGIRAGDVIVEVEGKQVSNFRDLVNAINSKDEGDVTITIVRDRNRQSFTLKPEKIK
ncbi:MAG: PDZ domain-containing protein, partial [Pyrinomonadaceae bacterium]